MNYKVVTYYEDEVDDFVNIHQLFYTVEEAEAWADSERAWDEEHLTLEEQPKYRYVVEEA